MRRTAAARTARRLIEAARRRVQGPAIGLMAVGAINAGLGALIIVLAFTQTDESRQGRSPYRRDCLSRWCNDRGAGDTNFGRWAIIDSRGRCPSSR